MKPAGLSPARVAHDADGTPVSARYGDLYHPRHGALAQARHVFLAGNGLPERWRHRRRFVVLETGFGLGSNFLATWSAWLADPGRSRQLWFVSIEAHPLHSDDLAAVSRDPAIASLAAELHAAWPAPTRNVHRLSMSGGRVQLLLFFGDVSDALTQVVATVDAFYLDGFAPDRNPAMWEPRLFKAMARIAAVGATVATWSVANAVGKGLTAAGFAVRRTAGIGGKREITLAVFTPRFRPRASSRRQPEIDQRLQPCQDSVMETDMAQMPSAERVERVVIVGAGLAGCAVAWALAEQGIASLVLDRQGEIASEGSGQAAGIFHGVVHRDDGRHARFNRAAALEVHRQVAIAISRHGVRGGYDGLIRLDRSAPGADDIEATIEGLGLPAAYVRGLDADAASRFAGVTIGRPGWLFRCGGWVEPRGLARSYIERSKGHVRMRMNVEVSAVRHIDGRWHLLDAAARSIESASTLVLANAGDAARLIQNSDWPLEQRRGQLSGVAVADWPGAASLRMPIAGSGYLLPAIDGVLWFGATSQAGDDDPSVRFADHAANLEGLRGLVAASPQFDAAALAGRTGFRCASRDRLPIVGAVPLGSIGSAVLGNLDASAQSPRPEHPRFAPRAPGLFVMTGLGSRGIAWSALAAQCLASTMTGAPAPLEADLLDAIDPARFASRNWRRRRAPGTRADGATPGSAQPPVGSIVGGSTGG